MILQLPHYRHHITPDDPSIPHRALPRACAGRAPLCAVAAAAMPASHALHGIRHEQVLRTMRVHLAQFCAAARTTPVVGPGSCVVARSRRVPRAAAAVALPVLHRCVVQSLMTLLQGTAVAACGTTFQVCCCPPNKYLPNNSYRFMRTGKHARGALVLPWEHAGRRTAN